MRYLYTLLHHNPPTIPLLLSIMTDKHYFLGLSKNALVNCGVEVITGGGRGERKK